MKCHIETYHQGRTQFHGSDCDIGNFYKIVIENVKLKHFLALQNVTTNYKRKAFLSYLNHYFNIHDCLFFRACNVRPSFKNFTESQNVNDENCPTSFSGEKNTLGSASTLLLIFISMAKKTYVCLSMPKTTN